MLGDDLTEAQREYLKGQPAGWRPGVMHMLRGWNGSCYIVACKKNLSSTVDLPATVRFEKWRATTMVRQLLADPFACRACCAKVTS